MAQPDYYKGARRPDWATPRDFFEQLNDEFNFNLDPCASHDNHKCERYFTIKEDGLAQSWNGRVYMNPPYGREIKKWVKKAFEEISINPNCEIVVALLPARTDTSWFHDYIYHHAEIRFLRGRIRFEGADGPAPFPSMIVIWRKKDEDD